MLRLTTTTRRAQDEILTEATRFFGPTGVGLAQQEASEACAVYEGGGGYVRVDVCRLEDGLAQVAVEGREWDEAIRRFVASV